jgi:hypothetical protein
MKYLFVATALVTLAACKEEPTVDSNAVAVNILWSVSTALSIGAETPDTLDIWLFA